MNFLNKNKKLLFTVVLVGLVLTLWPQGVWGAESSPGVENEAGFWDKTLTQVGTRILGAVLVSQTTMMQGFATLFGALLVVFLFFFQAVAGFSDFINAAPVVAGWVVVRDLCNNFFIVFLLVIAVGTILRVENYSYKRLLSKVLVIAVLINFSRTFTGLLIDVSQVIMLTFFGDIGQMARDFAGYMGVKGLLSMSTGGANNYWTAVVNGTGVSDFIAAAVAAIFLLVACVVVAVFFYMLLVRIIVLWFLIVLSPLAYLLSIFPQGQTYANKWWDSLTKQLVTGPAIAFFLWLSFTFLENILGQQGNGVDSNGAFKDLIPTLTTLDSAATGGKGIKAFITQSVSQFFAGILAVGMLITALVAAKMSGAAGSGLAGKALASLQKGGSKAVKGVGKLAGLGGLAAFRGATKAGAASPLRDRFQRFQEFNQRAKQRSELAGLSNKQRTSTMPGGKALTPKEASRLAKLRGLETTGQLAKLPEEKMSFRERLGGRLATGIAPLQPYAEDLWGRRMKESQKGYGKFFDKLGIGEKSSVALSDYIESSPKLKAIVPAPAQKALKDINRDSVTARQRLDAMLDPQTVEQMSPSDLSRVFGIDKTQYYITQGMDSRHVKNIEDDITKLESSKSPDDKAKGQKKREAYNKMIASHKNIAKDRGETENQAFDGWYKKNQTDIDKLMLNKGVSGATNFHATTTREALIEAEMSKAADHFYQTHPNKEISRADADREFMQSREAKQTWQKAERDFRAQTQEVVSQLGQEEANVYLKGLGYNLATVKDGQINFGTGAEEGFDAYQQWQANQAKYSHEGVTLGSYRAGTGGSNRLLANFDELNSQLLANGQAPLDFGQLPKSKTGVSLTGKDAEAARGALQPLIQGQLTDLKTAYTDFEQDKSEGNRAKLRAMLSDKFGYHGNLDDAALSSRAQEYQTDAEQALAKLADSSAIQREGIVLGNKGRAYTGQGIKATLKHEDVHSQLAVSDPTGEKFNRLSGEVTPEAKKRIDAYLQSRTDYQQMKDNPDKKLEEYLAEVQSGKIKDSEISNLVTKHQLFAKAGGQGTLTTEQQARVETLFKEEDAKQRANNQQEPLKYPSLVSADILRKGLEQRVLREAREAATGTAAKAAVQAETKAVAKTIKELNGWVKGGVITTEVSGTEREILDENIVDGKLKVMRKPIGKPAEIEYVPVSVLQNPRTPIMYSSPEVLETVKRNAARDKSEGPSAIAERLRQDLTTRRLRQELSDRVSGTTVSGLDVDKLKESFSKSLATKSGADLWVFRQLVNEAQANQQVLQQLVGVSKSSFENMSNKFRKVNTGINQAVKSTLSKEASEATPEELSFAINMALETNPEFKQDFNDVAKHLT